MRKLARERRTLKDTRGVVISLRLMPAALSEVKPWELLILWHKMKVATKQEIGMASGRM